MAKGLKGLNKVIANLNKEIGKVKNTTMKGLLDGGFIIQRAAQERVPREYGKLHASASTGKSPDNDRAVRVQFTAGYAAAVHEGVQVHAGEERRSGLGVYWGPDGEPKYLENAVTRKQKEVLSAIQEAGKIKT